MGIKHLAQFLAGAGAQVKVSAQFLSLSHFFTALPL